MYFYLLFTILENSTNNTVIKPVAIQVLVKKLVHSFFFKLVKFIFFSTPV